MKGKMLFRIATPNLAKRMEIKKQDFFLLFLPVI